MKKLTAFAATAAFFIMATGAYAAKLDKVDVCHREGNGSFHLININGNALSAHVGHGDKLLGELVVNPDTLQVDVTYGGHWYYTANFIQNGTVLTGSLTDPYVPGDLTGPILDGSINGSHVVFSFDYGPGSVQGVRTYVGDIQSTGDLVGKWSQTGSQSTGEEFDFVINDFASKFVCE